jgi:homospermidine synthase
MNFDRKILANLSQYEPYTFKAIIDESVLQANPPNMRKPETIDYKEAIQRKMLYFGPFTGDSQPVKDKELRFFENVDKTKPDWFG